MNILITGAKGFVGRNLTETLKNIRDGKDKTRNIDSSITIFEYDLDTPKEKLDKYCSEADFVFHLAGVNRPKDEKEFMEGNFGFTSELLDLLKKHNKIMISYKQLPFNFCQINVILITIDFIQFNNFRIRKWGTNYEYIR